MPFSRNVRLISLFSGCGGMDLPFHDAGFDVAWAIDSNADACKTFRRNIADVIVHEKIENVDIANVPDADIVIGGFPCQDFSLLWKRPGLEGERGSLYLHFLEFIRSKKPKIFVAENVKGLLSINNGQAIQKIISDFEDIAPGYVVKPMLYNFADYGVPQLRERVLLVGVRLDTGFDFTHPKPEYGLNRKYPHRTAGSVLEGVESAEHNNQAQVIRERTVEILKLISPGGNFADIPKDNQYYVKGMISHVYRRLHADKPSTTIIAAGGGGTHGYHYAEPRPLTNRERARLQGFPDDFIFEGSSTEVRRQIGNAVPPSGLTAVVEKIKLLFDGCDRGVDLYNLRDKLQRMTIKERLKYIEAETGKPTYLIIQTPVNFFC
jgi:DNA (cytosine-5)-methyltransferase 1